MYNFEGIELNTNKTIQKHFEQLKKVSTSIRIIDVETSKRITKYTIEVSNDSCTLIFYLMLSKSNKIKRISDTDITIKGKNVITQSETHMLKNLMSISEELFFNDNKEILDILNIIKCSNYKCPICGSEMQKKSSFKSSILSSPRNRLICTNSCYYVSSDKQLNFNIIVKFFPGKEDSKFICLSEYKKIEIIDFKLKMIHEIQDQINYWKENDKYLIYLLE